VARVIIVTGASAGIGLACADRLHRAGWEVIGASRRGTSSGSGSGPGPGGGGSGGWTPLVMDVDSDDQVRAGVTGVLERHGTIDAVVACAGWGLSGPVENTPIEDAKQQFETNFWGAVRLVQAALPTMRKQGSGRIVLVGSLGGLIALPFQAFYSASKYAMEGYGEALAYEVAPFGIKVTIVEPGNIKTDFTASRRDVPSQGAGDPYLDATHKAISIMERDEAAGASPDVVAGVIEKVLDARRPPRRVSAGKFGERIGVVAKRVLPHSVFEKAAKGALGV
jgi:NAD(P)-dependent dehydrogenase (short-subunit alcohol dehydrogenase family)